MPYYYLAQSLTELDQLARLVEQLEKGAVPIKVLKKHDFIAMEVGRIKLKASSDILFFGHSAHVYLRTQLMWVYDLISRLLQLLRPMPQLWTMTDQQRYTFFYAAALRDALGELAAFLETFRDLQR